MKYNKAFLTGCDYKHEWILPWFFENYKKHNNTPLIFADFGVKNKDIIKDNVHAIINLKNLKEKGWFKKPKAMLNCPSEKTVWLDTDCQVLSNIDSIFELSSIIPPKLFHKVIHIIFNLIIILTMLLNRYYLYIKSGQGYYYSHFY